MIPIEEIPTQSMLMPLPYTVRTYGCVIPSGKLIERNKNASVKQDAVDFLEQWLNAGRTPYCALLGEYGMGKTTTCRLFTQIMLGKRAHYPTLPFPIYLDLRTLEDKTQIHKMDLNTIIQAALYNSLDQHPDKTVLNEKEVIRLVREEDALVIFDGLDEVLVHLPAVAGQQFTRKLLGIVPTQNRNEKIRGRVLLTCRTHFFRTLREQKAHFTGEDRIGITAENYTLFTLLPFTSEQIYEYLQHAVPDTDTNVVLDLIHSVHNLSELAERPYTLSLIPGLISKIEQWKKEGVRITGITIYRHVVMSWLSRDSGKHRLTTGHKQQLMEHFAAELWKSGKQSWSITNIENWFIQFLTDRPDITDSYALNYEDGMLYRVLEAMKEDLRTATFLIRIGESDFCFAHTSLQEFFLASHLCRALVEQRLENWDMAVVSTETLGFLGQLLIDLHEAQRAVALQSLCAIRDRYRPRISELGLAYMLTAHTNHYPTPSMTGMHLEGADLRNWNIVGKIRDYSDRVPSNLLNLEQASFSGAHLEAANLRCLNLSRADFSGAHLAEAEITGCYVSSADFKGADLSGTFFKQVDLSRSSFRDTKNHQTQWLECSLHGVTGLESVPDMQISHCEPIRRILYGSHHQNASVKDSHHQNTIEGCVFSSQGQYIASASWDKTVRIWDWQAGEYLHVLRHEEFVRACAFSSDGRWLATAASDMTPRLWDVARGECLQIFHGHSDWVRWCALSADGKWLASASEDQTIRLWDIHTGQCERVFSGHSDWVRCCVFSKDSQLLISASEDQTLRLWSVATGECVNELSGHSSWVRSCAISDSGEWIASGAGDKTLRIWDIKTGKSLKVFENYNSRVRACSFSPDGRWLASGSDDHKVRLWDVHTGECMVILQGHEGKVRGCSFSPDGQVLLSSAEDRTLRLWEIATGECFKIL